MQAVILALLLTGGASAESPVTKGTIARNAFNLKRTSQDKPHRHLRSLHVKPKVNHTYAEHDIEVWFINQAKRTDRKECIERQLLEMGITPNRFEALEPTMDDLKEGGKYYDCVKGGLAKSSVYIDATGGGISSGKNTKLAIIGNTCSHKRLFDQLAKSNSTAKYFVVLEDDAVLNPLRFKTSINEFVDEQWGYKGKFARDFQMVQLDFIGSFCMNHQIGRFGGKRVFKPKDIYKPGIGGADCSRYFGAQALLMQKDTLPSVVEHIESHSTLPMDWYQAELPRALAWRPQIARSPIQKFNKLPTFCSKKVHTSSISLKDGDKPASFKHIKSEPLANKEETKSNLIKGDLHKKEIGSSEVDKQLSGDLDLNSWMDAFTSETHADDGSDDVKGDDDDVSDEDEITSDAQ